jgi:hypothetical protein
MSLEQTELRRMARSELQSAWAHAKRLPAHAGDTVSAFARRHPIWAMGGAAVLAAGLASRRHRKFGLEGKPSTWPVALAAAGTHLLPELLRLVGLRGARRDPPAGKAPEPP